jgi:predicted nucleic acid-binding protein
MIEKAYIDTSVLAAYYCPETISENAEKLLISVTFPFISYLTEVELFSVLSKKYRKGELNKKAIQKILETYRIHLKENYYQRITVKSEHYQCAADLLASLDYALHSLDALHLAIAVHENIPFITADKNLVKVAKRIKTRVHLVK